MFKKETRVDRVLQTIKQENEKTARRTSSQAGSKHEMCTY